MIGPFKGPYRFLSNFYRYRVGFEGYFYPTVEHAYQAAKTLSLTDRFAICNTDTPGEAKKLGRSVPLREGWDSMKLKVMLELLRNKFMYSPLKDALLATGTELLVEVNTWGDTYWGVCNNVGSNNLGKLLMKVRYELILRGGSNVYS